MRQALSDRQHRAGRFWRDGHSDSGRRTQVTGLDSFEIGQMVGRQLPFLTIIVLFWIMAIMDGWRGIKETWPAVMVAGGSFRDCSVPQL